MADSEGALYSKTFATPFFKLALANVISNLMVPLAGLIDTAFLGHLSDIRHLAGVALATVVFNILYWSFGFLRMGTTGMTAQARGRADESEVWLVPLRNGLIALAIGLLLILLQQPIRTVGFALLGAESPLESAGFAFFDGRIWGAPAVLLNLVLLGWFLGLEQGRWVIVLSVIGNGGNILLDYWFIRHLGWASGGAGLATALSQYLMLIVGLGLVFKLGGRAKILQVLPRLQDTYAIRHLFQLNRDIMIRTFALLLSFSLFTSFSADFGSQVLAANTLLLQVITLASYFIDGIAFATESFAGRFYSSGANQQLIVLLTMSGACSLTVGCGFALSFALMPGFLFGFLTSHTSVVTQASAFAWWLVPTLTAGAIAYLLDGYFLGLTAGRTLRNATLLATGIGFLPLAFIAHRIGHPHILWLALASFMGARALSLIVVVPSSLKGQKVY